MTQSYPVEVVSYSGRRQAERPLSFVWQNQVHSVDQLEREWLGPRGPHFLVRSADGSRFHLASRRSTAVGSSREAQGGWFLLSLEQG